VFLRHVLEVSALNERELDLAYDNFHAFKRCQLIVPDLLVLLHYLLQCVDLGIVLVNEQ
jgi:hypothetical protein